MKECFVFHLQSLADKDFFSSRSHAALLRKKIESELDHCTSISLDFSGVEMTQSFADELVGVLAFIYGKNIFSKIKFKGCSEQSKKILNFVVNQRVNEHLAKASNFDHHLYSYQQRSQFLEALA